MTRRARRLGRGVLALAAVVVLLTWWTHGLRAFTTDSAAIVAAGPLPRMAPPLIFRQSDGSRTTLDAYRGRYLLLTFMYLHCPDVCHLVTARLHRALAQLLGGPVPERLLFLSVSLDPARDSIEALAAHWRALNPASGWTVGMIEVDNGRLPAAALARLGVWMARLPNGNINHAASSFLIDPAGQVVAIFRPEVSADSLAGALRAMVQ